MDFTIYFFYNKNNSVILKRIWCLVGKFIAWYFETHLFTELPIYTKRVLKDRNLLNNPLLISWIEQYFEETQRVFIVSDLRD